MTIATNTEQERIDTYKRAQDAADGIFPDPLTVYPGEPRDIVKVNAIKPIVDATVNYLVGKPPEWQIPQEQDVSLGDDSSAEDDNSTSQGSSTDTATTAASTPPPTAKAGTAGTAGTAGAPIAAKRAVKKKSPEEEWLEECLRLNKWPQFLLDLGYNGATCGTPFYALDTVKKYPNPKKPAQPYPRFYAIDPVAMTVKTDPMDITQPIRYEWRFLSFDQARNRPTIERKVYTRADSGAKWVITHERSFINITYNQPSLYGSTMIDSDWEQVEPPIDWLYSWPPIDHCKNLPAPNQVYGAPDVTDTLIDANNAINFSLSNDNRIFKQNGHPLLFFENYNGDITQMEFSVGTVTGLAYQGNGPAVNVKQVAPVIDVAASQQHRQAISNSMLEESGTPSIVLGDVTRAEGVPSGIALRMRMQPMLQKTETKRKLYEPFLVELIRRLFVLGGFADDIVVTMVWPELVPIDDLASMQSLQLELNAGLVSKETAATQRGRDWEEEQARIQQEKAANMEMAQQSITGQPGGNASPAPAQGQPGQDGAMMMVGAGGSMNKNNSGGNGNQGMMGSSGNAGRM